MHIPYSAPGTRLFTRDSGGSGSTLSTGSIIAIVVVCACVGLLVLTLFLWRLLIRLCRPSKHNPLPPVQELAHRREQQLTAFSQLHSVNRPTTWLGDSLSSRRSQASHPASSATSLLPGTPTRKSSPVYTDEGATAESSYSAPAVVDGPSLHPPNPAFFGSSWDSPSNSPHNSFVSAASLGGSTPSLAPSPSPSVPFSETSSSGSHITAAGSSQLLQQSTSQLSHPRPSRPNVRADSRSRRQSFASIGTNYSSHTLRSASVIRGAPHGPYSNIQIVLPVPLADQSLNSVDGYSDQQSIRAGVLADQWVTAGSRQGSVDSGERSQSRGRRGDRRPSSQPARPDALRRSSSSDLSSPLSGVQQRSFSQPRPTQTRPHIYTPPPVPRIPEVYDSFEVDAPSQRGRSVQPKPTVTAAAIQPDYEIREDGPMQVAPSPVSPQKPRVLHKPR